MNHEMEYDGQVVHWKGRGKFKASSGLPDSQVPSKQCIPDSGPIPEGLYKIFIGDHGSAKDDGRGLCALKPSWGIQNIPRGSVAGSCDPYWENWGSNRARMEPANITTKMKCSPTMRGGFYLHDSTKGYSHGCIEVEGRIFKALRDHNKLQNKNTIIIKVKYKGVSTNGGTKT